LTKIQGAFRKKGAFFVQKIKKNEQFAKKMTKSFSLSLEKTIFATSNNFK